MVPCKNFHTLIFWYILLSCLYCHAYKNLAPAIPNASTLEYLSIVRGGREGEEVEGRRGKGRESSKSKSRMCMLGVNMPDHATMFSSLHKLLVKHITPHVVSLHSSKCQALKSAVLNIALQLVPSLSSQVDCLIFLNLFFYYWSIFLILFYLD